MNKSIAALFLLLLNPVFISAIYPQSDSSISADVIHHELLNFPDTGYMSVMDSIGYNLLIQGLPDSAESVVARSVAINDSMENGLQKIKSLRLLVTIYYRERKFEEAANAIAEVLREQNILQENNLKETQAASDLQLTEKQHENESLFDSLQAFRQQLLIYTIAACLAFAALLSLLLFFILKNRTQRRMVDSARQEAEKISSAHADMLSQKKILNGESVNEVSHEKKPDSILLQTGFLIPESLSSIHHSLPDPSPETSLKEELHGEFEDKAEDKIHKITDLSFVKKITGNDEEKIRKNIFLYLEIVPQRLKEIQEALNLADYRSIGRSVHAIKPHLRMMGMNNMMELLEKIEYNSLLQIKHDQLPAMIEELSNACKVAIGELNMLVEKS